MESFDFNQNLDVVQDNQRQMEHYVEMYPHNTEYLKWVPRVHQYYVSIIEIVINLGTPQQQKRASNMLANYPKFKI